MLAFTSTSKGACSIVAGWIPINMAFVFAGFVAWGCWCPGRGEKEAKSTVSWVNE